MKPKINHPLRAVLFLLVTFGLTQLSPSIGFGQLSVFYTDFNSGVPSEFSGVTATQGVQGYAGLGTGLNVFSGDFLYNDSGGVPMGTPGSPTTLTLTGLPPHTSINLNFLLAIIDSWDGGYPLENAPDVFSVRVDGNTVFSETFTNVSAFGQIASYPNAGTPTGVTLVHEQQLGFNTLPPYFLDSAYNMGLEPAFQNIPHTASTLTIEWFAGGDGWQGAHDDWQPGNDESWGIDNVEVTVNQGLPSPQAGSFVIGDLDAVVGRRVTFWDAQWRNANHLSGGSAPASFEGFANVLNPNPPTCGGTWQTDPGNSCLPPAIVPTFINVIAASSITQSGSVIYGNNRKMVIIQTDPGYDPNPGHTGTGTVTAVICDGTASPTPTPTATPCSRHWWCDNDGDLYYGDYGFSCTAPFGSCTDIDPGRYWDDCDDNDPNVQNCG